MPARVMLSSVTKDDVPLGNVGVLSDIWYQASTLAERFQAEAPGLKPTARISFTLVRSEIQRHLEGKYGFEVYNFQNTPSDGGSPEKVTIEETHRSHLTIGLYGSQSGWKVPDQDPLTPTFREWRAALENSLKFKVFVLKGSLSHKRPADLDSLMQAITDYKSGMIYAEFADAVELFVSVDRSVRDYLNKAVIRYAQDHAARQPNSESERWLLLPYRTRVAEMKAALEVVGAGLGIKGGSLQLEAATQPVELHCVPDSFSIPESKKFAAYIFDDEASVGSDVAPLHIVAAFGGITDNQIRRHLGNFEAAEVYGAPWGFYAAIPAAGMQCVYLPRCVNSLVMQSRLSEAISWLVARAEEIIKVAVRRNEILKLGAGPMVSAAKTRKAGGS